MIGHGAYLADLLKPRIGVWPVLAIIIVPVVLMGWSWGRPAESKVARTDLIGAGWYLVLTACAVSLAVLGYLREDWTLYMVMIAPGAILSGIIFVRFLRERASSEAPGIDTPPPYPSNKPIE